MFDTASSVGHLTCPFVARSGAETHSTGDEQGCRSRGPSFWQLAVLDLKGIGYLA